MLYHYYSRRFPFDWLNILGALSVIRMSFVNDRDLKDQTIQAKVPFLSVLVVFCCQSFPFLLFFCFGLRVSFSFPSIGFFRLVCCAFSSSVTCSHSPMHFVAEGSASLFLTSLHLPVLLLLFFSPLLRLSLPTSIQYSGPQGYEKES